MTRDFGARRSSRTLRRDRRPQPLPTRRGQARRASACRVAAAEGTEQRTANPPGLFESQRATARAPSTRTVSLVGERRQIVQCRSRFGACRSCAASMLRPSDSLTAREVKSLSCQLGLALVDASWRRDATQP